MTDRTEHDQADDALVERDEEVRRLLAEARHDGGLPADVAVRLDRVLEQLAAGETRGLTTIGELTDRRRRRARAMLVAAAVVAAVGVGLGQVVPGGLSGLDAAPDTASLGTADHEAAGEAYAAEEDGGPASAGGTASRTAPSPAGDAAGTGAAADGTTPLEESQAMSSFDEDALVYAGGRPVRIRSDRFAGDAMRVRDRVDAGRRGASADRDFGCQPGQWGPGTRVAVLYDGRPHVLAFRAPAGDTQVVDLLQCGTGEILRSTTLPAG